MGFLLHHIVQFLLRFQDYGEHDISWIPKSNFANVVMRTFCVSSFFKTKSAKMFVCNRDFSSPSKNVFFFFFVLLFFSYLIWISLDNDLNNDHDRMTHNKLNQ